ncbi:MAG: MCE family protein [Deltaproteobacteria bacterium]|nr:MCE family protein [Deltaproteobacteria bacterium]
MRLSNEAKVGFLLFATLVITVIFAWLMGASNPFKRTVTFHVNYNFAGGIEVGSPVRVAGIKVGKVEKISFFVPEKEFGAPDSKPTDVLTPLRLRVSIDKEAAEGVRKDSKFFINIAGIIGERYVEITPGSMSSPKVGPDDVMRGVDPPRIDQLISQSFDLAGKIKQVIEENEGDITKSIKLLYELSANINKTLGYIDRSKMFKTDIAQLINNLIEITGDVKVLTAKTKSDDGKKTLELLHKLLWRLEPLDKEAIQKFFQKEGIRTRLF